MASRRSLTLAFIVFCEVGVVGRVGAQSTGQGTIVGHVLDSAGHSIAGAQVHISAHNLATVARTVRTRRAGHFVLVSLPVGNSYQVIVRHLGYRPDTITGVTVHAGDTTHITVALRAAVIVLPTATVRERRAARFSRPYIDSAEISNADVPRAYRRHAWDVILFLRPVMLGNWNWKCGALQHVFVNGERVTARGIFTPRDVLEQIPADDILEMRYVDCWDITMPGVAGQDAVYVVLKPGRGYRR